MAEEETLDLSGAREIFNDHLYRALLLEVEPFYRWLIFRHDEMIQEGVSISEEAGCRAVRSVVAYFRKVDHKIEAYRSARGEAAASVTLADAGEDAVTELFDWKSFFRPEE